MANDFEVSTEVAAPPDEVWRLAGDPGRVGEWFAAVAGCTVEGDVRTARMTYGAVLTERLVDRDEAARRYSYEVVSGIPGLTSHRATISVTPSDAGSRVTWHQRGTSEVEGYDMEARLRAPMTDALAALKALSETGATSR